MSHWDNAPADATRYGYEDEMWFASFYKLEDGILMDWVPGVAEYWSVFDMDDEDIAIRIWHMECRPA